MLIIVVLLLFFFIGRMKYVRQMSMGIARSWGITRIVLNRFTGSAGGYLI